MSNLPHEPEFEQAYNGMPISITCLIIIEKYEY